MLSLKEMFMQQYEYAYIRIHKILVESVEVLKDISINYYHYSILFRNAQTTFNADTRNGLQKEDYEAGAIRAFISQYEKAYDLPKSKRKKYLDEIALLNYLGSHSWELVSVIDFERNEREYYFKRLIG